MKRIALHTKHWYWDITFYYLNHIITSEKYILQLIHFNLKKNHLSTSHVALTPNLRLFPIEEMDFSSFSMGFVCHCSVRMRNSAANNTKWLSAPLKRNEKLRKYRIQYYKNQNFKIRIHMFALPMQFLGPIPNGA